jgi:hypothetical protein
MEVHAAARSSNLLSDGDRLFEAARRALANAEEHAKRTRYLNAARKAARAASLFEKSAHAYRDVVEQCHALDRQRTVFLEEAARARARHDEALANFNRYGGAGEFPRFVEPVVNGPIDFALLAIGLRRQQDSWDAWERHARQAWEEQQAALRAQERRRQAEAHAAREFTYDFSGAFSGSSGGDSGVSFGSSDSSSGGSFDFGGDSSSGGSY